MKSILLLLIFIWPGFVFSFSGNGSGTIEDPYQITTAAQLQEMNDDLTAHYILMNKIDAAETADWNNGKGFVPIGNNDENGFTGSLDGQNHSVYHLKINRPNDDNLGLFGFIGVPTDEANRIRCINILECNIIGKENIGGLAGMNSGIIEKCSSSGFVEGLRSVGGLVGVINAGKIEYSSSSATSNGLYDIGGFCGLNSNADMEHCYATGLVYGTNQVGGFCGGSFDGSIICCHSSGAVDGTNFVGGFCGFSYSTDKIKNCYSTSYVNANEYVGGFCGKNTNGIIQNCYSNGYIFALNFYGGFCGVNEESGIISDCYWDTGTSGCSESNGGEGKSSTEMKNRTTYVDWDFEELWQISPDINNGYPTLQDMYIVSVEESSKVNKLLSISSFPNPFSEFSVISYQLSEAEPVKIVVYNSLGREIAILVDEYQKAGRHEARFDASGHPAGMYYYNIWIGKKTHSGKMILVR